MKHMFALSTPRQRLLLAALLLAALLLIVADVTLIHAQAMVPDCPVCADGTTKYEVGSGYEYGQEHAEVTVAGAHASWQAKAPAEAMIHKVCVKAGLRTYDPSSGPRSGSFTVPEGKNISHVVIYMARPTGVGLTDFTADPQPIGLDYRFAIVAIILMAGGGIGAWTLRDLRSRKH